MRLLQKDAPATFSNGPGKATSDLDHVIAASHLKFKPFGAAHVSVRGWPKQPPQAQAEWIKQHSDHGVLFLEAAQQPGVVRDRRKEPAGPRGVIFGRCAGRPRPKLAQRAPTLAGQRALAAAVAGAQVYLDTLPCAPGPGACPGRGPLMNNTWKFTAVAAVGAVVGFTLESSGPLGSMIWPLAEGMPDPEGANMGLLIAMGAIEAIAFGIGIAFLAFGWSLVSRAPTSRGLAIAAYLSIAWGLVNWVPHTAMHMSHGNITTSGDYAGLVMIEYMFHLTLIIAACILGTFAWRTWQATAGTSIPSRTTAPASTTRKA